MYAVLFVIDHCPWHEVVNIGNILSGTGYLLSDRIAKSNHVSAVFRHAVPRNIDSTQISDNIRYLTLGKVSGSLA